MIPPLSNKDILEFQRLHESFANSSRSAGGLAFIAMLILSLSLTLTVCSIIYSHMLTSSHIMFKHGITSCMIGSAFCLVSIPIFLLARYFFNKQKDCNEKITEKIDLIIKNTLFNAKQEEATDFLYKYCVPTQYNKHFQARFVKDLTTHYKNIASNEESTQEEVSTANNITNLLDRLLEKVYKGN